MSKWSDKILELSENAGYYSQARLAKAIDWNPSTLNSWFQGDDEPNVPTQAIVRLAAVLNISPFSIMPDYIQEDGSFERAVALAMGDHESAAVDQSVIDAVKTVHSVLIATLHELDQILANIEGD